jgi:hypothetical protein
VEEVLVGHVVHGQELDGGDAQRLQVGDRLVGGQPGERAPQVLADARMARREALDVQLVDDGLVPGRLQPPVAFPVEGGVDDDALRDRCRVVLAVGREVGFLPAQRIREDVGGVPVDGAVDRLRVGVDQELGGVEAVAPRRLVGAVDAVAVALSGADVRQVAVPVEGGALGQRVP